MRREQTCPWWAPEEMVIDAGDGVRRREGAGLNRRAEVVGRPHSAGSADGLRLGGDARGTALPESANVEPLLGPFLRASPFAHPCTPAFGFRLVRSSRCALSFRYLPVPAAGRRAGLKTCRSLPFFSQIETEGERFASRWNRRGPRAAPCLRCRRRRDRGDESSAGKVVGALVADPKAAGVTSCRPASP